MPWFHFSIDSTQWWLNCLSWGRGCWPRPLRPRSRRSAPRRVSGACRRARTSRWTEAPTHGPGNWKIVSGQFRCWKLKSNMLFYIFFFTFSYEKYFHVPAPFRRAWGLRGHRTLPRWWPLRRRWPDPGRRPCQRNWSTAHLKQKQSFFTIISWTDWSQLFGRWRGVTKLLRIFRGDKSQVSWAQSQFSSLWWNDLQWVRKYFNLLVWMSSFVLTDEQWRPVKI